MPITSFRAYHTSRLVTNTQAKIAPAPINWPTKVVPSLLSGTINKPNKPTTPCTEIAPTGSSIFSLSRPIIEATTSTPPTAPNKVACSALGVDGSAVMATKPAKAPFNAMVKSALRNNTTDNASAATAPAAAAALVFKNTIATALALLISPSFNTEPPLKPNQPIHKINVPKVAKGMFAPGIALTLPSLLYLPLRAPSNNTPANAAAAPAICTMPEPAKSEKPNWSSRLMPNIPLVPQVQEPCTG